ncbi:hypothetical protein [Maribacter litoralis]|uniref:hypothetical protein n=1 Tax=Maribacter litoralis TaxID=2059726 RepID=UPI003D2BA87F
MSLTRQEVLQHIEEAHALLIAKKYAELNPIITAIQDNLDVLGYKYPKDNARYYRFFMLYMGAFEKVNIEVMHSYVEALEQVGQVLASDYEYICSYYKTCPESVYEKALQAYPYNETLHIHYALKLKVEKRYTEAIAVLKYVLECYPATTEARFLLWEIESAQLDDLVTSSEEADCYELLNLASATHNLDVLKGLQLDTRLDKKSKHLTYIQVAIWENRSVEIIEQWNSEWKSVELTDLTRNVLADYAKAFMIYELVPQILKAPQQPEFPQTDFTNFTEYKAYMQALTNSGWQLAQHHYLLLGNAAYFYSNNKNAVAICLKRGLELNEKNPLLLNLKAMTLKSEDKNQEAGAIYHEAFRNGLTMDNYLLYLIELNNRIESYQGVLDTVKQFHIRHTPTLKSLFFKARALFKFHRDDEALVVLNEALQDFPLRSRSYAPWMLHYRMIINKRKRNYTQYFIDQQAEINYYVDGDDDYFNTTNLAVETIFEQGEYEECYKYAIYNHEQGKLAEELYPIFQWICFYDFLLEKPEDLQDVTEANINQQPETFEDFRNNGLIYWMLDDHTAAAESLMLAASKAINKAIYLKLALTCAQEGFKNALCLTICETIRKEVPEAREFKTDYIYANILNDEQRHQEAYKVLSNVLKSYPERAFFEFPKDFNYLLHTLKNNAKALEDMSGYNKYISMLLSRDNPIENQLREQQDLAKSQSEEDLFLQHNFMENLARLNFELYPEEQEELKEMKMRIKAAHFA